MYVSMPLMHTAASPIPMGDTDASGCTICQSCASGYLTAFVIGGLVSAVVLLGALPAVRLHKEIRASR
jgi:hypothetical protein